MARVILQLMTISTLRRDLAVMLAVFVATRALNAIPLPGVPLADLSAVTLENPFIALIDLFTGGGLARLSIAALGLLPYIAAQTAVSWLQAFVPRLDELRKEGEMGRIKIETITRTIAGMIIGPLLTYILLALTESYHRNPAIAPDVAAAVLPALVVLVAWVGLALLIGRLEDMSGNRVFSAFRTFYALLAHPLSITLGVALAYGLLLAADRLIRPVGSPFDTLGLIGTLAILASASAGSMLLVWLAQQIKHSGIQLLIASGCLAALPRYLLGVPGSTIDIPLRLVAVVAIVAAYLLLREGQHRVPVQYAKRVRGSRGYGGQSSHIPIPANIAGLAPLFMLFFILCVIHHSSAGFLNSPIGVFRWLAGLEHWLTDARGVAFWVLFFLLGTISSFTFGTARHVGLGLGRSLERSSGFIPGIRPGLPTEQYLALIYIKIALQTAFVVPALLATPALLYYVAGGAGTWPIALVSALFVAEMMRDLVFWVQAEAVRYRYDPILSR